MGDASGLQAGTCGRPHRGHRGSADPPGRRRRQKLPFPRGAERPRRRCLEKPGSRNPNPRTAFCAGMAMRRRNRARLKSGVAHRARHAEGGRQRQTRPFVYHSNRCGVGHRNFRGHRRRSGHAHRRHRTRDALTRSDLFTGLLEPVEMKLPESSGGFFSLGLRRHPDFLQWKRVGFRLGW
jgi:hypothetical protein